MRGGTQEERDDHCARPRQLVACHRGGVDMSQEKGVNGFVPLARKFTHRCGIPPEEKWLDLWKFVQTLNGTL